MKYNYTIIIPHKNSFQLLLKLLKSIPERDDLQVIVVDDNSILEDVNLKVFSYDFSFVEFVKTNEGKGAGYVRNIGLTLAKGKWILFADSDDTFISENLDRAMDECINLDCDVVFFDANCLDINTGSFLPNLNQQYKKYIYSKNDRENKCKFYIRVPWGKFIKRELIDKYKINFEEIPVANDIMFSVKVGFYSKIVIVKNYPIYNWMVHQRSITSNRSASALLTHFMAGVRRNQFLEQQKVFKYRRSHFCSIISLHKKIGLSWRKAIIIVVKYTPTRFIIKDFFSAIYFYYTKMFTRFLS